MIKSLDALVEIGVEEIPAGLLQTLTNQFAKGLEKTLSESNLEYESTETFATPRRVAIRIVKLISVQPDQNITKRGPAKAAAFDADGNPTKALLGFAKSNGVDVKDLTTQKTDKGEWFVFEKTQIGLATQELLPQLIEKALKAIVLPKVMRWGDGDITFIRPVHWVLLLYGNKLIKTSLLGIETNNQTHGHRTLKNETMTIKSPEDYETTLEKDGFVIASFSKRRQLIQDQISEISTKHDCKILVDDTLLDEVTGLVEWPNALLCHFDEDFLKVPQEALISAMEDHQKSFPVLDEKGNLKPYFVTVSNLKLEDPSVVIHGNERVMRARLSDAKFFYESDVKVSEADSLKRLEHVSYHDKLGNLYEKSERLSTISEFIAGILGVEAKDAKTAGRISKTDLVSDMVGEFPELQGTMGYYYAIAHGHNKDIATALKEQYLPRFSKDKLPRSDLGAVVSLSDKIDAIVGYFGINQIPTGEKDPFGLRRAALGVIRIILEKDYVLSLDALIEVSKKGYGQKLTNKNLSSDIMEFIHQRLRSFCVEKGISPDVFNAVHACGFDDLSDFNKRLLAVNIFCQGDDAKALASANKRVSKLLQKSNQAIEKIDINNTLFENESEKHLFELIQEKQKKVQPLFEKGQYNKALTELSTMRQTVDKFFDDVMVMVDDDKIRNNRLALLLDLQKLFLKVADVSLLQLK